MPGRTPSAEELSSLADRLNTAVGGGDRVGFLAAFTAGAASQAGVWFDNARSLKAWRFERGSDVLWLRSRAAERSGWNSAAVVPVLDADATIGSVSERAGDLPAVWVRQRVEVFTRGSVAVIAGRGADDAAQTWLDAAHDAVGRLSALDLHPWRSDPQDASLTVELPTDLLAFGQDVGTGAYVRMRRDDDEPCIVTNPTLTGVDAQLREELMAHEAVHALTRSPGRAAPSWAIEGFAEHWAERVHPALQRRNADLLRGSTSTDLPTEAQLRAGLPDAYPRAARAVAAAQQRWGEGQVAAWIADWAGSRPPADGAFAAELSAALTRG